jgi:hypothetical protein
VHLVQAAALARAGVAVVTPDPVWHFSGRSQSAAWTALNGPYRDAVLDDRSDEAAEIMATDIAPDFEYKGRRYRSLPPMKPRFVVEEFPEGADPYEDEPIERPMAAEEARAVRADTVATWKRLDLTRWIDPAPSYRFVYPGAALAGMEEWEPLYGVTVIADPHCPRDRAYVVDRALVSGFDRIDRSIALDSDLHPPRIGERQRVVPSGRLPNHIVLEGMAPEQPTRFEFTDPDQRLDLERHADGWRVVQTVRSGAASRTPFFGVLRNDGSALLGGIEARRGAPYRPRWASRLAATLAEGLSA